MLLYFAYFIRRIMIYIAYINTDIIKYKPVYYIYIILIHILLIPTHLYIRNYVHDYLRIPDTRKPCWNRIYSITQ